jgi:hypothetical protein
MRLTQQKHNASSQTPENQVRAVLEPKIQTSWRRPKRGSDNQITGSCCASCTVYQALSIVHTLPNSKKSARGHAWTWTISNEPEGHVRGTHVRV